MKSSSPSLSIIIPIYNAQKYLHRCLDSVLNQTIKDLEIFCIDDGSTDDSWRIIQEFAKKDKRIKAIRQKNNGAAVARNRGLERATGEYIGFLDSDDYVDRDYFEKLYQTAKEHSADISVAYVSVDSDADSSSIYVKTVVMGDSRAYEDMYNVTRKKDVERNKLYLHGVIWLSIFKRSMLEEHNIAFYPELRTGQDSIFLIEASYYANRVRYVEGAPTYYHRVARDGSLMSSYNFTDKGLLTRTLVLRRTLDFINSKPNYDKEVYIKRAIDNLMFIQSRLQYAKSVIAINQIAKRISSVWSDTKYKDNVAEGLDAEFVQTLNSRYRLFLYIYKVSHPQSNTIKLLHRMRRVTRAVLPYGLVIIYRIMKNKRAAKIDKY